MWSRCGALLGLRTRSFRTWCRLLGRALHALRRRLCARWLNLTLRLGALYLGLGTLWLLLHRPLRCYLWTALWLLLEVALRFDRPLRRYVVVRLYRLHRAYVVIDPRPVFPWLIDARAIDLRPVWLVETLSIRPRLIDSWTINSRLVHAGPVLARLIDSRAIDLWPVDSRLVRLVETRPVDARLIDARAIDLWPIDSRLIDTWAVESPWLVDCRPDGGLCTGGAGKGCLCRASVVLIEKLLPVL